MRSFYDKADKGAGYTERPSPCRRGSFSYFGQEWPLVPKTAFYDWLYLTALCSHQDFLKRLYSLINQLRCILRAAENF